MHYKTFNQTKKNIVHQKLQVIAKQNVLTKSKYLLCINCYI